MPVADPYQAQLRGALVGAVATKLARQRRRAMFRRAAFATVAVAALLVAVITVTLPNDRASASIQVETRDGSVVVRLLDFENSPDEIVGALRNGGIDASVEEVPVGPSNVGHFVSLSSDEGGAIHIVQGNEGSYSAFSVPQNLGGLLQLKLGRVAQPAEQWASASDATAKGEVLSCRDLRGLTALEAFRLVADTNATVSWMTFPGETLAPGAETVAPYASWRVIDALSPSAGLVLIRLTVDGSWPFLTQPPPQTDPSCKGK